MLWLLTGCLHMPPDPSTDAPWSIDRSALPAASLQVFVTSSGALSERLATGHRGPDRPILAYAYALHHPTAGVVVIDPGYGLRTAADPADYPGRAAARLAHLQMGTPLVEQLAAQGIAAEEVQTILLTHMHTDHAGGVEDFPAATVVIDPQEWAFGVRRSARRATLPLADVAQRSTRDLDFTDSGCGPFPRCTDVFSDGVLIALSTPGHTPGHTAFLVNLPGGSWLITGDTAWFDEHWQLPSHKGRFASLVVETDWQAAAQASWYIKRFAEAHPDVTVLSGHDPANLERVTVGEVYR